MLALLLTLAQAQPTYVAYCDGDRATLVARLDDAGPVAAAGLPRPAEEQLARDVAGITFHHAERTGAWMWTQPFTAPVHNETGGTPYVPGTSALGDPAVRKVVLGACSTPGLMVSEAVEPDASGRTGLAVRTADRWIQADVKDESSGTRVALTVVGDAARELEVELSYFGC